MCFERGSERFWRNAVFKVPSVIDDDGNDHRVSPAASACALSALWTLAANKTVSPPLATAVSAV